MNVTFREAVPFYGEKSDLNFLLEFVSPSTDEASREGENRDAQVDLTKQQSNKMEAVISAPLQRMQIVPSEVDSSSNQGNNNSLVMKWIQAPTKVIITPMVMMCDIRALLKYIQGKNLGCGPRLLQPVHH
jgi:hypothetical protein